MAEEFKALAVDLGASNGRAVLGTLSAQNTVSFEDIRRFPNRMEERDGALRWDFDALLAEVRGAIDDCIASGRDLRSIGIDTWGVDYALFNEDGSLVEQPVAYRDHRTDGVMVRFLGEAMSAEEVYGISGIQFMPINTIYQLAADVLSGAERLKKAHRLLMMSDAFAFALSGKQVAEYTIASTSQMLDAKTRRWSEEIVERMGLRRDLLPDVVEPGTKMGAYKAEGAEIEVVVPAGHDTAAAVAAVPSEGDRPWAYISSGTWTLVGVEGSEPLLSGDAREFGLTNEGGVEGTLRQLKNVTGLWLIQECMRIWQDSGRELEIQRVCELAAEAPENGTLIDPDHPYFLSPDDMVQAIAEYCRSTGQEVPEDVGRAARCIFESLALKTRFVLDEIARITGTAPQVVHMVGGGTKNTLLCRMTADACGRLVIAGPAEATATGNLLMQAMAAGRVESLAEIREIVRGSFALARYEPSGDAYWDKRYERFRGLLGR